MVGNSKGSGVAMRSQSSIGSNHRVDHGSMTACGGPAFQQFGLGSLFNLARLFRTRTQRQDIYSASDLLAGRLFDSIVGAPAKGLLCSKEQNLDGKAECPDPPTGDWLDQLS